MNVCEPSPEVTPPAGSWLIDPSCLIASPSFLTLHPQVCWRSQQLAWKNIDSMSIPYFILFPLYITPFFFFHPIFEAIFQASTLSGGVNSSCLSVCLRAKRGVRRSCAECLGEGHGFETARDSWVASPVFEVIMVNRWLILVNSDSMMANTCD